MKTYHFTLLFIIFLLAAVIKTDISIGKLKAIENEYNEITANLSSAISDAVNYLSKTESYGGSTINKEEVLNRFFTSLYSSLGIISDTAAQAEIEIYMPVILLCDVDGYYIYHYDEYKDSDGNTYLSRTWTEKTPYSYEDDDFIYRFTLTEMVYLYDKNNLIDREESVIISNYKEFNESPLYLDFRKKHSSHFLLNNRDYELVRKGIIINKLEDAMAYYTSNHNYIARRQGITYSFSFPMGNQDEWAQYIDDVNILVVFQGYPYGPDKDYTYNKVASAGANIVKKPKYHVEEKSWYMLAHQEGCEKVNDSTILLEDIFDSLEDCVKLGAYSCECIEYGARVPDINKPVWE